MPVHYITLPLLVFTGIYAAIGLFFLVSYLRVPDMQSNHVRWFIAADFMAILYNVMRIFKYHAATCDTAYFWVRATHVVIPILAAAISGFLADYSRQSKQWIIQDMIVIFGVLALVSLFGGNYVFDKATCSISTKSFLHVSFFHIWFRPGPIATAIYGFLILSVLYASFHGLCWGIEGNPRETRPIIAGGAMMAVVIVSDVLTSYRLISFVFLGEFVFSFFLIAMCYSTINLMSTQLAGNQANPTVKTAGADITEIFKGMDITALKTRLLSLMGDQKLYREEAVSLEFVADRLGLHPSKFSRFMNLVMNTDFRNFINSYRVEEAKRLLSEQSDLSIKYICYDVGFQSKSTFNDVFKKHTGTTPSAFRKQKQ